MAISTFGELKTAVQNWSARTDQIFVARIPDFVALAEHRIFYGSKEALETAAIRVRQMETEFPFTPSPGTVGQSASGTLPDDYLSMRRVYLNNDYTFELTYLSPQEFWTNIRISPGINQTGGFPSVYTIEGQQIWVGPVGDGTVNVLYYRRFPALAEDEDTNWLLENVPGIYFNAALAEAWGYSRNAAQKRETLQVYAGLASGLNIVEQKGRRSGASMAPQPLTHGVSDRGTWGTSGGGW